MGKWTYNAYDPSTKDHVFACSALRKCYCGSELPPNPPPPPDPPSPPPPPEPERQLSYVDEPDMSEQPVPWMLEDDVIDLPSLWNATNIEWTNRTPVDTSVVAGITVDWWPDMDEHYGPWSQAPRHQYRRRVLEVVDRDTRL